MTVIARLLKLSCPYFVALSSGKVVCGRRVDRCTYRREPSWAHILFRHARSGMEAHGSELHPCLVGGTRGRCSFGCRGTRGRVGFCQLVHVCGIIPGGSVAVGSTFRVTDSSFADFGGPRSAFFIVSVLGLER